ncbi:MAG: hypothetical protein KH354_02065 [Clostridiales bacterium]|nr:hypothetical protein [Clostridiales bacterium]
MQQLAMGGGRNGERRAGAKRTAVGGSRAEVAQLNCAEQADSFTLKRKGAAQAEQ